MRKIITTSIIIISVCIFSCNLKLSTAENTSINVYAVPPGSVPDGEITITGLEISQDIIISFDEISTMTTNGSLEWFTETIDYKGSSYVCSGIDPLELLDHFNIWYPGNIRFQSSDFGTDIDAKQIQYGLNPRNVESDPENLKILLSLALDGNWLYDGTAWSDDGPARLICPANSLWEFESSDFVKNVEIINITEYYSIPISFDGVVVGHIDLNNATDTELFNYTSYDILNDGELLNYAGTTVKSIGEQFDINSITGVSVDAVDLSVPYYLPWSKFVNGFKDAILVNRFEGDPIGFAKGPFRLLGGDLTLWESVKYVWGLNFHTVEGQTTTASTSTTSSAGTSTSGSTAPGFDLSTLMFTGIAIYALFSFKKRR